MSQLKGKKILLGVSSSIAAYKALDLASALIKLGAEVRTILTPETKNFLNPLLFESLTHQPCLSEMFEEIHSFSPEIRHISWAQWADAVLLAPATANLLAKCANGLADDRLTTTLLACTAPVFVAPAMNSVMLQNPLTQEHFVKLQRLGWRFIEPVRGKLACGLVGEGKLASIPAIVRKLENYFYQEKYPLDLSGKKILVTAGPTREALDPVRFITNHSSGKMGYALAEAAAEKGAEVYLISGPVELKAPESTTLIQVTTAEEMFHAVQNQFHRMDWAVLCAAVADYRPQEYSEQKIKKYSYNFDLPLQRTHDIAYELGAKKQAQQILCGFAMETENLLINARKKRVEKNMDLICCNSLNEKQAGFQVESNHLYLIDAQEEVELPVASKRELAEQILMKMYALEKELKK